jgi:choline transport protein
MGYAVQVKRDLNVFQLTGTAFSITASWIGVTGGFAAGVLVGGSVVLIWGLVIITVVNVAISVSLAELISAMPNSGGQYYWAMRLAPPRYARFFAYATGMLNLMGGLCATASISVLVGHMVMGSVSLFHPEL